MIYTLRSTRSPLVLSAPPPFILRPYSSCRSFRLIGFKCIKLQKPDLKNSTYIMKYTIHSGTLTPQSIMNILDIHDLLVFSYTNEGIPHC